MAVYREFGYKDEVSVQEYDDLAGVAPDKTIPDADTFFPVTGGDYSPNEERIDRNDEARGRRAASPPRSFRAAPTMTVPLRAYPSLVAKSLRKTLGAVDSVAGAMSPYTHTLGAVGQSVNELPTVSAQLVRDDLNHKMAGSSHQRISLSFPLDGEGTMEAELWGLYGRNEVTAPPTPSFASIGEEVLMLRDAQVFVDGSMTAITNLQGFDFSFVNNLNRKFAAKRNVVSRTIGTPATVRKVWWPYMNKISAAQDVTYRLAFADVSAAQELAQTYAQAQKLVFECEGGVITGGVEILRITIYAGVHTGGGPEGLSARDDLAQSHDGGAFYSQSDGADIKVEYVSGTNTPIT